MIGILDQAAKARDEMCAWLREVLRIQNRPAGTRLACDARGLSPRRATRSAPGDHDGPGAARGGEAMTAKRKEVTEA